MTRHITDLLEDVLGNIMYEVAKAPDGAHNVARSMATCKHFRKACKSRVVLKAVCFKNAPSSCLFQRPNGILKKCAKAGNHRAVHLFAKVILTSCYRLLDDDTKYVNLELLRSYKPLCKTDSFNESEFTIASSIVAYFIPSPGWISTAAQVPNPPLSYHWEYVKDFILKATPIEIRPMKRYFEDYIRLFTEAPLLSEDAMDFVSHIYNMIKVGTVDEKKKLVQGPTGSFVKITIEEFVAYQCRGHNLECISPSRARDLFEKFRAKALESFDLIIPKLQQS